MLTGENGILSQAQKAKTETENAQAEEENILANYESYLNSYSGENTEFTDSLGNKVIVPAGFRVVNPEDNVEDGIVIEDVTHSATAGSQFVWIPVGIIHTSSGDKTITLSRYTFDSSGITTDQGSNVIGDYFQELASSTYGNTSAKNIEEFRTSATTNGGYYLGRYEARDGTTDTARTSSTSDTNQLVCTASNYVYNYVTQSQAASLSQGMYAENSNFTSDLVNSYAWDTAIVFIQECSGDTDYSRQIRVTSTFAPQGTNNLDTKDQICNIFDMASNCREWTTETYSTDSSASCVTRGGVCGVSTYYTATRGGFSTSNSTDGSAFRPLLYL